jgi:hypothetical protein
MCTSRRSGGMTGIRAPHPVVHPGACNDRVNDRLLGKHFGVLASASWML